MTSIAPLYPTSSKTTVWPRGYSPSIAAAEGEDFAWELASDAQCVMHMKQICAEDITVWILPKDFVSWGGDPEVHCRR